MAFSLRNKRLLLKALRFLHRHHMTLSTCITHIDAFNGTIVAGYVGSFLMAGGFMSIGACMSAMTKNQVIAFIIAATVCFLFTMSGLEMVLNFFHAWAPPLIVDTVASLSFLVRFDAVTRGVIDMRDVLYFMSLIAFFLFTNVIVVEVKKSA